MAQINQTQPNFNTAAEGLRVAATELTKYVNIPAVREGTSILEAIQQMEDRLTLRIQAK
jgi:hypothetical protein